MAYMQIRPEIWAGWVLAARPGVCPIAFPVLSAIKRCPVRYGQLSAVTSVPIMITDSCPPVRRCCPAVSHA